MKILNVLLLLFAVTITTSAFPAYPLKSAPGGRYLIDQNGKPFLMVGDAAHSLIVNLSESDAATYMIDRKAHGFNTIVIYVLCNFDRADGSTLDGILPFTGKITSSTNYDLTTPNETYFKRVDDMVNIAATNGLMVILDPIETSGWLATMDSNGTTKCHTYGQYLGNRYKSFTNVMWQSGNDFQTWANSSDDAVVLAVAGGILSVATNQLQTIELNYLLSSSLDDSNWDSIVGINFVYTYYPTYAEVLHAYNQSTIPVIMGEANYEFETNPNTDGGSTSNLRRQEYWTLLSGATGQLYGNHYLWSFISGWQSHMDTIGATQFQYSTALFSPRTWYNLIPDTSHSIVTAGYGTFSSSGGVGANNYVTAAGTPDGGLVMAYIPATQAITVNMSKLSGVSIARWYDPTSGTFTNISGSPFSNTGSEKFTPPSKNSSGGQDWVIVIEKNIVIPPPTDLTVRLN
ncbi:MAG: DUF4038 domain-containing protein [Verrucomicrobiota bacterium]